MQINWFTFSAQIVNFLILLWLLKHFLYTPLLNVMKNREDEVLSRLEDASNKLAEAEQKLNEYQSQLDQLDKNKKEWIDEAKQESESYRKELLTTARQDVDSIRDKWLKTIQSEKKSFLESLENQAIQKILSITETIVKDLSNRDLEHQTIQRFLKIIEEKKENDELQSEPFHQGKEFEVISSFSISKEDRKQIDSAISRVFLKETEYTYSVEPDLGFGIELRTDGWKLGWNLKKYLNELRSEVDRLLNETLNTKSSE